MFCLLLFIVADVFLICDPTLIICECQTAVVFPLQPEA